MSTPRIASQAASLPDGRVLVAGGAVRDEYVSGDLVTSAEVFDPSTGRWAAGGNLLEPRQDGLAVVLQDGERPRRSAGTPRSIPKVRHRSALQPLTSVERLDPGPYAHHDAATGRRDATLTASFHGRSCEAGVPVP